MTGKIWVKPEGNMGNRALQYLAAAGIAMQAPGTEIQNILLPEWGMSMPCPEPSPKRSVMTATAFDLDVCGMGDCLARDVVDHVIVNSYPYHIDNYPPRETCRQLIGTAIDGVNAKGFGPTELVCSVRGAEILQAAHPDYLVLPPGYYKSLQERSGLELVFYGQIGNDVYSASLRAAFPAARFIPGVNRGHDFEVLRRSVNIAPSISTFAWLAAWLSEAQRIYLPVGGIFSPVQLPRMMFLPLGEAAYHYTLLPFGRTVDLNKQPAQFALLQDSLARLARPIETGELKQICQRAAALHPPQVLLGGFDPDFYELKYADVAAQVAAGMRSSLHHYLHAGFRQGRQPCAFDQSFYVAMYPDAAMAVAEGHYRDPMHHYQAVGHAKGYRPTP